MNSSGLRTEPWCTPTLTLKALLSLPLPKHPHITDTIHSSTPRYLSTHQTTSRGTYQMLSPNQQKPSTGLYCLLLHLTDYENSICRAPHWGARVRSDGYMVKKIKKLKKIKKIKAIKSKKLKLCFNILNNFNYSLLFSCSGTQCTTLEGWRLG